MSDAKCELPTPYDPGIEADTVEDLDGIDLDEGEGCPHCGGRRDNLYCPNAGYYGCETCGAIWGGDRDDASLYSEPHSGPAVAGGTEDTAADGGTEVSPEFKELIKQAPPAWVLASRLKDAYQIPESEWGQVLKFQWRDDDGTSWTVRCNGSGTEKLWTGSPMCDNFLDPSTLEVPEGCHFITVDGEALLLAKPDGHEFFCSPESTRVWEEAAIRAMHSRCSEKGDDLPDVEGFLGDKEVRD